MAKTLGSLPNNALVKDASSTYYGKPIIWMKADKDHAGYPANSVTLITKGIIKIAGFDGKEASNSDSNRKSYGNNRYRTSNLRQWLNSTGAANSWWQAQNLTDGTSGTNNHDAPPTTANTYNYNGYDAEAGFMTNFSAEFRAALLTTTLTVAKNTVTDGGSSETVQDKIFLASTTEVGLANENSIAEGSKLAIFSDNTSRVCNPTAEAVTNSTYTNDSLAASKPWYWWLRTPYAPNSVDVRNVNTGGTLSSLSRAYSGSWGVRPLCNLKSDILVSDTPDSDGAYVIQWNQPPTTPGSITVPSSIVAGSSFEISWGTATDPEGALAGYKLERSTDGGAWGQIYSGTALKYTDTVAATGVSKVQYRVKAFDAVGLESGYKTGNEIYVVADNPPTISGVDSDLGLKTAAFTQEYTVSASAGATITVVEKIDGVQKRSYTAQSGAGQTFDVTQEEFIKLINGSHTLTITASNQYGSTATRTYTFSRNETTIEILRSTPMNADAMPERVTATVSRTIPIGAILKIYVCNNGADENPTWEDATNDLARGMIYHFTNKTKTAANWGVNIKVCVDRNGASGECAVEGIGGNFD